MLESMSLKLSREKIVEIQITITVEQTKKFTRFLGIILLKS